MQSNSQNVIEAVTNATKNINSTTRLGKVKDVEKSIEAFKKLTGKHFL